MGKIYQTEGEILLRAKEAIGLSISQIDNSDRINTGKGAIGNIIEESWFGLTVNNESRPDFEDAGVELKATPYNYTQKGKRRAKERLVCNIINYMEENLDDFYESSFWKKCKRMLLMSYEHKQGVLKSDFTIDAAILFSFPEEDLAIIQNDWNTIMEKVRNGNAHNISESDTLYLAACTKGATADSSYRNQPFSDIKAKQRAYSLKQSYMTYILNSYIFGDKTSPCIIKDLAVLQKNSFEDYIVSQLNPYIGKTEEELRSLLHVESRAKNVNEILLARMLGVSGRISETAEFKKAGIVPKTIRLNKDDTITENMSFAHSLLENIVNETWENSAFREYLTQKKFLFVVFKQEEKQLVFDRVKFWNITDDDLIEVEKVWRKTKQIIEDGVIQTRKGLKTFNNLPASTENPVCHVRPHGKNAKDVMILPNGETMPKQCFWFNRDYVKKQLFE